MKFGGYENFPHQKDRLFPVINPEKRFYIIWEGMMLPFIAFAAIVTPTELAFYADVVPFWPLRDDVGSWTRFMWTFFALNRLVDLYARRRLLLRFSIIAAPPPRVRSRRRRGGTVAAAAAAAAATSVVRRYFLIDMLIVFNTAVFDADVGVWILDRREIATRYLESWFLVDLISILPSAPAPKYYG